MTSPARFLVAGLAALAALAGCDRNPATGRPQLALVSEPQEIQLGRDAAAEVARSLGVVENPELQRYVNRVGHELARHSERPLLPWQFRVVDDPVPNAFALPGGQVFVTRGMLALMTTEAELATVLGHEIGHVTARHAVNQMTKQQLAELGLNLGVRYFPNLQQLAGVAGAGLGLLFLKYGRDAERQADELGFRYAYERNYDVREMADVFVSLQRAGGGGGDVLPGWLQTHPAEPERIRAVEQRLAKLKAAQRDPRVGRDDYLQRVDGLPYGENPRNGFFRNGTFYHPEMKFRFDVPPDWRTQNLTSAVMALAPGRDALVQLTLSPLDPAAGTRALLAQAGVRGTSTREDVNGVPALITRFEASTPEQGAVRGFVAFLSHRGSTYQLVAYAPAAAFAPHETTFRRVIGSFAPLTDARALAVKPARISVVRLARAASLREFAARFPDGLGLDELAWLNQIDDPARRLPPGTLLKQVVGRVPDAR